MHYMSSERVRTSSMISSSSNSKVKVILFIPQANTTLRTGWTQASIMTARLFACVCSNMLGTCIACLYCQPQHGGVDVEQRRFRCHSTVPYHCRKLWCNIFITTRLKFNQTTTTSKLSAMCTGWVRRFAIVQII